MAGRDERPWLRACRHVDCPIERCLSVDPFDHEFCKADDPSCSLTRGRVGSISGGTPLAAPQGDAGSSPAASTVPEQGGDLGPGETRSQLGGVTSAPALAWRTIDVLLPHLEAKLARVTGHGEWRFGHLRLALEVLRNP